jgi:hypothetical protein
MNKLKQRKLIAEFCGWTEVHDDFKTVWGRIPNAEDFDSQGALESYYEIPDYLNNYEELTKAVNKLPTRDYCIYIDNLALITDAYSRKYNGEKLMKIANASLEDRIQALLRTLNKWEDDALTT